MKTFTFCSFKGGTSKTSSCLHIGACLSKYHKKRCLLIDLDPQANLSTGLGIGPDCMDSIVSVIDGSKKLSEVIVKTNIPGLDLVSSNTFLDGIEKISKLQGDLYAHERLRRSLKEIQNQYDYCFIDTPPSLGWLTQSAFFASQQSIICSIPEAFSILALKRLRDFHIEIGAHHSIDVMGIILSFWDDRGAVNESFLEEIERTFPEKIFKTKIRRDVSVSRAVLQGKAVIETNPDSRASMDYQMLTKEILKRMGDSSAPNPLKKMQKTSARRA